MNDMSPLETVRNNIAQRMASDAEKKESEQAERLALNEQNAQQVPGIAATVLEEIAQYFVEVRQLDHPEYKRAHELRIEQPLDWKQRALPGIFRPTVESTVGWSLGGLYNEPGHHLFSLSVDGVPYVTVPAEKASLSTHRLAPLTVEYLESMTFSAISELLEEVRSRRKYLQADAWVESRKSEAKS